MKNCRLILFFILAVLGSVFWSFFQHKFIKRQENESFKLLFPIIVPFLATIFILIIYFLFCFLNYQSIPLFTDLKIFFNSNNTVNFGYILAASLFLSFLYFGYVFFIQDLMYTPLLILLSVIIFTFLNWFQNDFKLNELVGN